MLQRYGLLLFLGGVFALSPGVSGAQAPALPPSFTISASNATMPLSGFGSIPFTLTSVGGYTGTVYVECSNVNAPTGVKVPYCGGGPLSQYMLTANEGVQGSLLLTYTPVPAAARPGESAAGAAGLTLGGAMLLLGLGIRRRRARGLGPTVFAVGVLAFAAGVSGCGGGPPGVTPGTYAYTVTATDMSTGAAVSAVSDVTVP